MNEAYARARLRAETSKTFTAVGQDIGQLRTENEEIKAQLVQLAKHTAVLEAGFLALLPYFAKSIQNHVSEVMRQEGEL